MPRARRSGPLALAASFVVLSFAAVAEPAGGPPKPPAAPPPANGTGWISGTVLDEEGKPFPNADIDVFKEKPKGKWTAKSDAKGNFGVRGVPPGPATVVVRAKGRIRVTKSLDVPATGVVGADAKLLPGVRFAGVIKDTRDAVVGGVKILAFRQQETSGGGFSFSSGSFGGSGESLPDGTFEVDGLDPGERFTLRLVHPHFVPVDLPGLSAEAGGGHDHLEAILEDAGWVTGTITDKAGHPVAGVRVTSPKDPYAIRGNIFGFVFVSMWLGSDERNVSDAQGKFLIGCLDAEETKLSAEGPNHFPNSVLLTPTAGQETKGVTIVLEVATAAVEGSVVDGEGKPVPKASVSASLEDDVVADTVTADEQGRFRLTRIKAKKPIVLAASAEGYADGGAKDVSLDSKGARIELKRLGRLTLEVLGPDGKRVPEVTVRILTEANAGGGGTSRHDQTKGPVEMWVPLGAIDVMVSAKGCAEKKAGAFDVESGQKVDGGKVTLEKRDAKDAPDEPDDGG